MALPANALTLTLSDASTKIVYIQSQTFNWKTGHTAYYNGLISAASALNI